ncbi:MetQ/NlpA family ABC transporter substrate-binding protein [Enterococcus sp. AZ072]|uniref:MetQ/NlpA family ABC transporter substrate-binding protein n=1 Tax=unclassified Enterococcus TaxID=2608891 RepID=UPI003D27C933
MKKIYFAGLALAATVVFAACGGKDTATTKDTKEITVAVQLESSKDILEIAKKEAEKKGYTINIMEVSDNVAYNDAVQHEEADANFAQHEPFMKMFNQEKKADLVAVQPIYYFAGGFYSKEYNAANELPDNGKVGIPSDPTNEGRALAILNAKGVIQLKEGVGFDGTIDDVVENPKNLKFERVDLLNLAKAYDESDIAMVFCYPAYLKPIKLTTDDAILLEAEDASKHYALQVVTRDGEKDSEKIKVLKEAMTTKEVADYIKNSSDGANIPAF